MSQGTLPRLLYLGDVPVSNSIAGASLLYRLLSDYPPERLRICGPRPEQGTELPGVNYHETPVGFPRILRTRFAPWYCAWITWWLQRTPRWLRRIAIEFRPEAVLTISQTGRWLAASHLAQGLGVPLVLIAHDDHAYAEYLPKSLRPWISRKFAAVYRSAAARLCVSPAMSELYGERYGVSATVLYPSRDPEAPVELAPAPHVRDQKVALTFCYAGSLHDSESFQQLSDFCSQAESMGHRVLIYSPQADEMRRRLALKSPQECVRDKVSPGELRNLLRSEVDVLLVLGSFGADQREIVSTLFPSKMADYTAAGLPILCWAPEYASITRFVREFPGVAAGLYERDPSGLVPIFDRLRCEPESRRVLASEALRVGARVFAPNAAWVVFMSELDAVTRNPLRAPGAT